MIKPKTELIFWNAIGSMLRKWQGRGVPKARAFNLLRLWLGYDFTDLMDDEGCFVVENFDGIRRRLSCSSWSVILKDMVRSRSFCMFSDKDGVMKRFCSPIWHSPVEADGDLMNGSYVGSHKSVTGSDSMVNENNKTPKEKQKEKAPSTNSGLAFRDSWAEEFAAHYPTLSKLNEPLTEEQYLKVLDRGYSREDIITKLRRMENYKKILTNYSSCYLTLLDWLKN